MTDPVIADLRAAAIAAETPERCCKTCLWYYEYGKATGCPILKAAAAFSAYNAYNPAIFYCQQYDRKA